MQSNCYCVQPNWAQPNQRNHLIITWMAWNIDHFNIEIQIKYTLFAKISKEILWQVRENLSAWKYSNLVFWNKLYKEFF